MSKPVIAVTTNDFTAACAATACEVMTAAGYEVRLFPATGSGGRAMEQLIRGGLVAGVLDLTTSELADELAGGVTAAGPGRLTAAALVGVPQVISVGGLDAARFGPPGTVPERYIDRRFYRHDPAATLMRTTPEENDRIGKGIAEKASAARGPTVVLLPLQGVSALDAEGEPFWWPEADAALFQSIQQWAYPPGLVAEIDAPINAPAFAEAAAARLLAMLTR